MTDVRFLAVVLFSLFLVYSMIGNTALLIILYKDRNIFLNRTFVWICLQLIICAFIGYIPQVAIILPETLYEGLFDRYKNSYIYRMGISVDTFCFYLMLQFTFLLALSRYIFFILPKFNNIFDGIKIYVIVAFIWLLTSLMTALEIYSCIKTFNDHNLQWMIMCRSDIGKYYKSLRYGTIIIIPIIIFVMHIIIFNNLRRRRIHVLFNVSGQSQNISWTPQRQRNQNLSTCGERNNAEISILIQGAMICLIYELEILSFIFLRRVGVALFGDGSIIYSNILVNCLIIFLYAIQPTVYFIYNKRIRRYVTFQLLSKIKNEIMLFCTDDVVASN